MIPRKAAAVQPLPADWNVTDQAVIHGRNVTPGTPLSISGLRGRVTFLRRVTTSDREWIDVIQPGRGGWRSFTPDRVRTVHHRKDQPA